MKEGYHPETKTLHIHETPKSRRQAGGSWGEEGILKTVRFQDVSYKFIGTSIEKGVHHHGLIRNIPYRNYLVEPK